MKHCFWQVNEISRRLHRLKSKGEFNGTHEKSQFLRKLKKDMIRGKKKQHKFRRDEKVLFITRPPDHL